MDRIELLPGIFATSDYGLWHRERSAFVVADLHLGYEAEARSEGAGVPSTQFPVIAERIERILRRYGPKRLVIAGDLKHSLGRNRRQEWDEVNRLIALLDGKCELEILRGNHDNFLVTILRRAGLEIDESVSLGNLLVVHGHRTVGRPTSGWLVMGHEHPSIKLFDRLGAAASAQCFLWSSEARAIVLPAFSPIAFGRNVARDDAVPLSPMLARFDGFEAAAVSEGGLLRFGKVGALVSC